MFKDFSQKSDLLERHSRMSASAQPPPPTPIEPGVTCMLVPHHRIPPISGKGYTPYLGYWLPLAITKPPPFRIFSGNLPETTAQKYPPFPKKMGIYMRPPRAFGGRAQNSSNLKTSISQIWAILSLAPSFIFNSRAFCRGAGKRVPSQFLHLSQFTLHHSCIHWASKETLFLENDIH